jgi:hypothetical protein
VPHVPQVPHGEGVRSVIHFHTTKVIGQACQRCHRPVLTGLAEGLHARVDLAPLDPTGEVQALLIGKWTYTLSRGELVYRDAGRITGGYLNGPILAEHRCDNARKANIA